MALISVVIPCYNAGAYIEHTLAALEKQTFRDFNVILVDDCSTDDTGDVISAYKERSSLEIIYAKNEKNSGPAISRNYGISLSEATYICFCDSDDWYDENYLCHMVTAAQKYDADMVFCGYRVAFADNRPSIEHPLPCKAGSLRKNEALILNVDALWCLMVKREIAKAFPLPDLRNGEDMAVIPVWMLHAQRFAAIPDTMYNYLLRQGSLSNKTSMRVVDSLVLSFAHICENASGEYTREVEYIGIRNLVYGGLLNLFKCRKDKQRARQIISDFEKHFPDWKNNQYICGLPLFKRVFVKCAAARKFAAICALARIHGFFLDS